MKKGEIYVCEDCGVELQVVKECDHAGEDAASCSCHDDGSECGFSCCGKPLVKK